MKKILIFTDVDFWELCSGHRVRITELVKYLSSHFCLTVVYTGPAYESTVCVVKDKYGIELIVLEHESALGTNEYSKRLEALLKKRHFDVMIVEYIHCSYSLNTLSYDCHVILDTHDIISDRTMEFNKFNYGGRMYEMQENDEANIFNIYDHIMMINQVDFEKGCSMIDRHKVLLCPHPCEIHNHELRDDVKKITFVASSYLPNIDSITNFINNCWDRISSEHAVELDIYGTICRELSFPDKIGINLMGFESNLDKIYEGADIIINPVRFGAGLKIKNLEALAHGRPLVTTSHGARGMETAGNNCFSVADDNDAFVLALFTLIQNNVLRKTMQQNAHEYVKEQFSATKCFEPLHNAIIEFDITK